MWTAYFSIWIFVTHKIYYTFRHKTVFTLFQIVCTLPVQCVCVYNTILLNTIQLKCIILCKCCTYGRKWIDFHKNNTRTVATLGTLQHRKLFTANRFVSIPSNDESPSPSPYIYSNLLYIMGKVTALIFLRLAPIVNLEIELGVEKWKQIGTLSCFLLLECRVCVFSETTN